MDYEYSSIEDDKRDEDRQRRWWLWRAQFFAAILMGSALIAVLSSLATIGIMSSVKTCTPQQFSDGDTTEDTALQFSCGESFDDAHQRGCTFDPLTLMWLHPKCSQYGQQEFLEAGKNSSGGSWQYWDDKSGQHAAGNYEGLSMLPVGGEYWTTQEEHLYHCMWMLMRVHDAATTPGKRLDSKSGSLEHTKHCLEMLVEQAVIGAGPKISQINVHGSSMDIGWAAC